MLATIIIIPNNFLEDVGETVWLPHSLFANL